MGISITGLTALTNIDPKRDFIPIVDTSDTTQSINGSTRKAALVNIPSVVSCKRLTASLPAGGSSLNNIGVAVTNSGGGITHVGSDTQGFYANFTTIAILNNAGGIHQSDASFYRGSIAGVNGFNLRSRVLFTDASYNETGVTTGSRIGIGLSADTLANTLTSDDPAVERIMFRRYSVNAGAIDTNWQIVTRGAGVSTVTNTNMAFAVNKIYDLTLDCVPGGTTVDWSIRNVTDATFFSGSITATLPQATTALRGFLGLQTIDAVARNIRMGNLVVESIL